MAHRKLILLIEDDPDYEELIRQVLSSSEMFDVKSASSLALGLASIDQYAPEIILVDLNLGDSSGYETFLRVREVAAGTPIIVLTGLDDDEVALHAVEDGAQDYLVKSLVQPKLVERAMKMALSRQKRQASRKTTALSSPGTVLSFIGSKGGVGTSTTAVNVAALLANNGFETVVIELQTGRPGSLSLYLQTEPRHGLYSLLKKPADTITVSDLQHCLTEAVPGLHLLSPTASGSTWRSLDAVQAHAIISAARRTYRFVILDLPARIDEGIAQALRLSDSITMLADRELASIHCAAAFLQQIRTATSRTKEIELALVDRTDLETPPLLADIKRLLKMHPLAIIPRAADAIALSHAAKNPLVLLYPDDPYSVAHFKLTEQLLPPSTDAGNPIGPARPLLSHKTAWHTIPETTYS